MGRLAAMGLALTVAVTLVLRSVLGAEAVLPAAVFGGVATLIQLAAHRLSRIGAEDRRAVFPKGWLYGMGLRLAGVALVGVAAATMRATFPPIPTAFGFLGVLIPLLFLELRTAR